MTASLLAIALGGLGVHKFYLGQTMGRFPLGVVYLLLCITDIPAILGLIEGVLYLMKSDAEFHGEYVVGHKAML